MKNIIIILLIIFWAWYFYDLGQNKGKIEKAKKDMWAIEQSWEINKDKIEEKTEEKSPKETIVENQKEVSNYSVKELDNKKFIELDDLTKKVEESKWKITISWKVLNDQVDKIIISFKNSSSDFPNDKYELQNFKKWNPTFEYNADAKLFRNLDYWLNIYTIESYVWTEVSKIDLEINIVDNSWNDTEYKNDVLSDKITYDKKLIGSWDNSIYIGLPESDLFWKPLSIDWWKITYSNIEWLEINKDDFDKTELTSDNIWNSEKTWYLNKNVDSYVYWNTFREIDYSNKDSWVSFYVLRKDWDKYIYEKYYFDFNHSLKWVLKIKEFDKKTDDIFNEMSKLNNELKTKNEDFEVVKTTDKLFKEIVR